MFKNIIEVTWYWILGIFGKCIINSPNPLANKTYRKTINALMVKTHISGKVDKSLRTDNILCHAHVYDSREASTCKSSEVVEYLISDDVYTIYRGLLCCILYCR